MKNKKGETITNKNKYPLLVLMVLLLSVPFQSFLTNKIETVFRALNAKINFHVELLNQDLNII